MALSVRAVRWALAAAITLGISSAAAQPPESPSDTDPCRIETCVPEAGGVSSCCPTGVVWSNCLPAVSADGTRFALPDWSGGLSELLDLLIINSRGRQLVRKVIYARPDCRAVVRRGETYDLLSSRVPRRAAEANALLKKGRYRPLAPLDKDWKDNLSPHVLTGQGLRLEIDTRRARREVLTVTKGTRVIFRAPAPGIRQRHPERCPYHAPRLGGAWLSGNHLLVLLAYETGDDCGELNPPPRWLRPIPVP
jgi:hypothetical protein